MYGICNGFRDSDFNLGFDERRGRGDRGNPNLDPEMDIQQNREFYMHNDVRPPYTYAALIRYVSYFISQWLKILEKSPSRKSNLSFLTAIT